LRRAAGPQRHDGRRRNGGRCRPCGGPAGPARDRRRPRRGAGRCGAGIASARGGTGAGGAVQLGGNGAADGGGLAGGRSGKPL
ncbi:MAG: hypothetical protein AVDCRST_MAG08-1915, partial [uncultured Acetobacteraceae bacterium]